jgi:predicted TIM-barrel fold metal-dependent hydrolase
MSKKENSVNPEDMILISVDDHAVEPPNMFDGRLPRKYQDSAPHVAESSHGHFRWVFEDAASPSLTTAATVGQSDADKVKEPTSYADVRPGVYDIHERVKDMSANGVLAALNFPSFPRFCGQLFMEVAETDPGLALAVNRAYNDWHLEEWCGTYPGRMLPCIIAPLWSPDLMAEEVRRNAERGCRAVTFSMNPYRLGLPSLYQDHWDPFWAACEETGTIVCMHLGSDSEEIYTSPDAPVLSRITAIAMMLAKTASDLVWSPMIRKFPNLKFAMSEGGIGWVPYFLERADYVYAHHVAWLPENKWYGQKPSEIFNERILTCFIEDVSGTDNFRWFNPDMVTWECDYPHPDSTWPLSPEGVAKNLQGFDDAQINKITHENAMRIFDFDPFAVRPREQCTVGALRAQVPGRDVGFVPGRQIQLATMKQDDTLPAPRPGR